MDGRPWARRDAAGSGKRRGTGSIHLITQRLIDHGPAMPARRVRHRVQLPNRR
jgi:hypothetical protein